MQYTLTLLFVLFTVATNAQLTNGLIAHWDFNGNANDISGNNLNGTATNVTYTTGKMGTANTAANFNGTSSVIDVAYNSLMNSNAMSICAVVKFEDFYSGYCHMSMILQRGENAQPGSYSLCIFENYFDNNCNTVSPSNYVFHHKTSDIENYVSLPTFGYTPNVQKKQWYTVVATYDGFTTNIYVDGVLKTTYNSNRPKGTTNYNMSIGGGTIYNRTLHPYWMNGQIDDLRMYNRALTPKEVADYHMLSDTMIVINDTAVKHACIGDTFHLGYTTNQRFLPSNIFHAQLSDITGSFTNPILLGSHTSDTSGTIVCTIPPGLLPGTGSMMRVVATAPGRGSIASHVTLFDSKPAVLQVTANPTGLTHPGQSITYTANAGNAGQTPKIKWYRNGMWIANVNSDTLFINTLNHGDSIYAEVISTNPCTFNAVTRSNAIYVWSNTDVSTLLLHNLGVFPNPNTGSFNITADNVRHNEITIEIYNAIGQSVYKQQITPVNNTVKEHIGIPQVSNGVYLLHISADGKDRNLRLLINK